MFRNVRAAVSAATGGSQEPSVFGLLSGKSAYLGPPAAASGEAPAATSNVGEATGPDQLTAEKLAAERLYWDSVKDSSDPAELGTYLERYPNGIYAALARVRIDRLEREATSTLMGPAAAPDEPLPADSGTGAALGPADASAALEPEVAEEALGLQRDDRRLIQSGLVALGFDPGPADGLFGRRTRTAIGAWQASEGKPSTQYLDASAARALAKAGTTAPPPTVDAREVRRGLSRAAAATLSRALQAAGKIKDSDKRADTFADIGELFAEAGDMRRAMRSIDLALTAAEGTEAGYYKLIALSTVVELQAKVDDPNWAARTMARVQALVRRVEDESSRAEALAYVAEAQRKAGDARGAAQSIERALATAQRIEGEVYRGRVLAGIARAQAESRDIEGALATTRRIEGEVYRSDALSEIAQAQAESRDIEGALATTRQITDELHRDLAQLYIAEAQTESGDIEGAFATARQIEVESFRGRVLAGIANAKTESRDIQGALATTRQIEDELWRSRALVDIAKAQTEAGDAGGAARSIEQALATAQRIDEDGSGRDLALIGIAKAQAESGDIEGAFATAQRTTDDHLRAAALLNIARVQVKGGAP